MTLAPQWFQVVELECRLSTDFVLAPNILITSSTPPSPSRFEPTLIFINICLTVYNSRGNSINVNASSSINSAAVRSRENITDEPVGDLYVPMMGLTATPSALTWYPLSHSKGDFSHSHSSCYASNLLKGSSGEVLACFQVLEAKEVRKYPVTNITPQHKVKYSSQIFPPNDEF